MVAKGISQDNFSENGWETVQQIISDEDHDCLRKFSNTFASKGSPIFYRHSVVYFQEQQVLFENDVFSYMA